jgi:hypothetical protein
MRRTRRGDVRFGEAAYSAVPGDGARQRLFMRSDAPTEVEHLHRLAQHGIAESEQARFGAPEAQATSTRTRPALFTTSWSERRRDPLPQAEHSPYYAVSARSST